MQIRSLTTEEWIHYLSYCPAATFFHTPYWYQLWYAYYNFDYECKMIQYEDGQFVLLPLCWRNRLFSKIKEYFSAPVGTYGGPLSNSKLTSKNAFQLLRYLKRFSLLQIRQNPMEKLNFQLDNTKADSTYCISLDRVGEEITKNWSKHHRRALKKGFQNQLEIKKGKGLQDWKEYYTIYLDSLQRWGDRATSRYSWKLFKYLNDLPVEHHKLWLCYNSSELISGILCFYFNDHAVYWHGATKASAFKYKPVQVLHFKAIKDAKENGFKYYDLNPSGGHEGVENFKKGFGAIPLSANVYFSKSFFRALLDLRKRFGNR